MEWITNNPIEMTQIAAQLLLFVEERKKILLTGEIGAGKTTLVQAFCKHLGVTEKVTSPTFSLINQYVYPNKSGQVNYIHHIDLYRLKDLQEAIDIGIEDYLFDDNYCLIEWPEIIEPLLPDNLVKINIDIFENSSRKVLFL